MVEYCFVHHIRYNLIEYREQNEYALCDTAVYLAQGIDVVAGSNICLDHLEANANRFKYQVSPINSLVPLSPF